MSFATHTQINEAALQSFHEHLVKSKRMLALCGAGLSAASGLPTFRGAGGLWRTFNATELATPGAFSRDPGLVWQFYSYRRHMAMSVQPNRAHYALAEFARKNQHFMCLSQNVDGLSQRANHPKESLKLLHGSLAEVKCSEFFCRHKEQNFTDPIIPLLELPNIFDISDPDVEIPHLSFKALLDGGLRCTQCNKGLLRPGVVWFGESLPSNVLDDVDRFLSDPEPIDLILVIGTSSSVYPAAGYVDCARDKGARVATINMDERDIPQGRISSMDWFFQGDASVIVPELLKPVTGHIELPSSTV
ncbi:DHS-like NAD/FAD-binding domain-containing protein [Pseudovirgaria hyperparasitica]|uniref:DHS-like NAD/FAD-binding domain-containing protein n=1 Tax=Pseudovirgaria hyperparasitica TaxID=470096 RepID=A0A6A6WGV3_9PEZI|nr:DHS-like NAD/FAD-binding domain-containing protein [Pseudovirgaria hyperparasitica]KAF2760381.1 DHS-like NAD/FAD-binding domain-containing protein [Pseudovirgaria hyperparasitica]